MFGTSILEVMPSLQKAKEVYQSEGASYLLKEGKHHLLWKTIPNKIIWKALPESQTKHLIAKSKLLTTLFFYLRGSFYYEQKAILEGQVIYNKNEKNHTEPQHQIIRNSHRLEKGLSMRDRRPVFAEGYILDLVQDVITAWTLDSKLNKKQLRWSIDVLNEYFNTVDKTETITDAKKEFDQFCDKIDYEPGSRIPKTRTKIEQDIIEYGELKGLAEQRTSTRWFQKQKVPREEIDKALQIASESPSACNRQSFEFRFYDDDDLIEEISKLPMGAKSYRSNIPCLGVIVGKQRAYFNDRDKHVIYIDASLAAMAFQFGLESLNLSSCCINWPSIPKNDWDIAKKLNLDADEEVIMMMAIGYPDPNGKVPHSEKKDIDEIRSYNKH